MPSETRISTGTLDFSGGVDSQRVPTVASDANPAGLRPNQLAWAMNVTVRGGGVGPRGGWTRLGALPFSGLFQEAQMYSPDSGAPYMLAQIGGRTFKVEVEGGLTVTEVTVAGDANPETDPQAWMCQAEQFMVIQNGVELPLIWDGDSLRRSRGPSEATASITANFTVPEVGQMVDVEYSGPAPVTNATLDINGKSYVQVNASQWGMDATLPAAAVETILPIGTTVYRANISDQPTYVLGKLIAPLKVKTVSGAATIWLDNPNRQKIQGFPSRAIVGQFVFDYTFQNSSTPPYPEPADGHLYLLNVDDTPGNTVTAPVYPAGVPEIPAATAMDYYMGRLWMAAGRDYIAGDIVGGPSGTARYDYRDSVLKITENQYITEGGVFTVPTNAGNIRALKHAANLDTALGQGVLYVFTRGTVYSVNVVPTRSEWQNLSEPIQRVAQISYGTTSDRSIVAVNGDLFCGSLDGIRSFLLALRYFNQWGNRAISSEIDRAIKLQDQRLLWAASGIEFDNRLLETIIPQQKDNGIVYKAVAALDFDRMSTLQEQKPPVWEGVLSGLDIFRLCAGDFDGQRRAFAFVRAADGTIEVWEISKTNRWDENAYGEARINWIVETPSFTWEDTRQFKQLDTLELWFDQIQGKVDVAVYYRPDQHPCWEYWHRFQMCAPRNNCEALEALGISDDGCYPTQEYQPQFRVPVILPKPPERCQYTQNPGRPMYIGTAFQFKIVVTGAARLRGITAHAFPKEKQPYLGQTCL